MDNFVLYECLEKNVAGRLLGEFSDFSKVKDFIQGSYIDAYPKAYKHEPSYPYILVLIEEITENGRNSPIAYCYYSTAISFI